MKKIQKLIKQVTDFSQKYKYTTGFDQEFFRDFLKVFYSENIAHDFSDYSIEELHDSALVSFNFFLTRKPNEIKILARDAVTKKGDLKSLYTLIDIVNDDMPFLVDSVVAYLDKFGVEIKNIIHPTFLISRDKNGKLNNIAADENSKRESLIQIHIDKVSSESDIQLIESNIEKILKTASIVVSDWKSMVALTDKAAEQINNAANITKNIEEIKEFVSWVGGKNFILLGAREFDINKDKNGEYNLEEVSGSSFGVFRSKYDDFKPQVRNSSFVEVGDSVDNPYIIEVLKSRYRSKIHRATNAERIRVQKFSPDGKVIGEFRFIGLFTSATYYETVYSIPLVRDKVRKVIEDSGYTKGSHNYKDLSAVLESYPRDELFQIGEKDLLNNATGIVAICGRTKVRFFSRRDKFNRFVSCLIFIPRDQSNSVMRRAIREYLADIYRGVMADSFVQITESNLIRLHITIRTDGVIPDVDQSMVEKEITKMTKVWSDDLVDSISAKFGDEKCMSLYDQYKNAFSVSYVNRFDPRRAAIDISRIEECLEYDKALFNLYKSTDLLPKDVSELKIFSPEKKMILSDIMPILESFGFNVIQEHTYAINVKKDGKVKPSRKIWIHYFHLHLSKDGHEFSEKIKINFEKTISAIWQEVAQVGPLNRLIPTLNLSWKQVYMLRSYNRYLYQTGFRFDQAYVSDVLVKHNNITTMLVNLFETKFDPLLKLNSEERQNEIEDISDKIEKSIINVKEITDDAVLRRFFGVIKATLRTNYYQPDELNVFKGYVSFKFDCKQVVGLPLPLPHAEIFVYSSKFEAIHLRGGEVARGGLRWSDRHEDFRTEVLGLMKAQMTKNAVIVPVGSKGGFVLKSDLSGRSRDEIQQEGIRCYKTFLSGMLDLTDNVVNGKIKHPENVIRYDASDPYLVVAADKGTATFSDIANEISAKYNFWLGDAFASGGSVGYDHKKMGITAKGAWVSVMRHFRERGLDTQSQEFTCAGVGDLAGDVFGNGMLLSQHIKLVAAFNHMHIFFDPKPNVEKSFIERKRIFNLPRSSWMDYNKSLISKGGAIFERNAKIIKISPEIKEVLAIEEDELTPNDLIRAILKSPVDLLWNGGIGTYVKAESESDQEVGDRANDALRINGNELRCKVVGEGGNLGLTQKGRIEFALTGGSINSDAMDNSAGVDCSDREVNIKIALIAAMRSKKITLKERNKFLESMTDEVSVLVLEDNRLQTQAISIARLQGVAPLGDQSRFLNRLEKTELLNREIEFLPSRKEIEKRQVDKIGLTSPELCVMLAYSKMDIYQQLLTSDLLKDKYFESELFAYFPKAMQKKFAEEISSHQLRKEIIATQITNFIVNRVGIVFVNRVCHDSGFSLADVVKSLIIACDSFGLGETWKEIESLDGKITIRLQMQMFLSANKLLERSVMWLLRNNAKGDLSSIITRFKNIANELGSVFPQVLAKASRESFERKINQYQLNDIDRKLAARIAAMDPIASAFDIAEISAASNFDLKTIAKIYFAIGTRFSLKWLRSKVSALALEGHWQKLSSKTILEDLYSYQVLIAKQVVDFNSEEKNLCEVKSVNEWIENSSFLVDRFDNFVSEVKSSPNPDLSVFVVALNRLKPLTT